MKKIKGTVMGLGGPISVIMKDKVKYKGKKCAGLWLPSDRTISLQNQIEREVKQTFYHELIHAALHDTGLKHFFDSELEEALCDGLGMALYVAEAADLTEDDE